MDALRDYFSDRSFMVFATSIARKFPIQFYMHKVNDVADLC